MEKVLLTIPTETKNNPLLVNGFSQSNLFTEPQGVASNFQMLVAFLSNPNPLKPLFESN